MRKGFLVIDRSLLEWEWYQNPVVSRLYVHLILKVNYKDKKWQGIIIKRGQLVTSNEKLSLDLNLTIQQIRTALDKLANGKYIIKKATNKYTLITVSRFDYYQSVKYNNNNQDVTQLTFNQQSINKQTTTTKQSNNYNNLNKETIESRKQKFKNKVFALTNYSDKVLKKFFNYWSEEDIKGKMRFEGEQYWKLETRLEKWKETDYLFSKKNDTGNFSSNR